MKIINFQVNEELHKQMRLEAIRQDKSIKQYVTDLIQKDLDNKKEQSR
jgi:predicted HicB family RNase H-like nuclease